MKIIKKCQCGTFAVFNDPRGTYITPGGYPDEKGRLFYVEKIAEEWEENHIKLFHPEIYVRM